MKISGKHAKKIKEIIDYTTSIHKTIKGEEALADAVSKKFKGNSAGTGGGFYVSLIRLDDNTVIGVNREVIVKYTVKNGKGMDSMDIFENDEAIDSAVVEFDFANMSGEEKERLGIAAKGTKIDKPKMYAIIKEGKYLTGRGGKHSFTDNYELRYVWSEQEMETAKLIAKSYNAEIVEDVLKAAKGKKIASNEMSEEQTKLYIQSMTEEDWNKMKPENKEKYQKYRDEGVDLFENPEFIPSNIQVILERHEDAFMDGDYNGLAKALKEVEAKGFTFDYYLDGVAYDLRRIGMKGKSQVESDKFDAQNPKIS